MMTLIISKPYSKPPSVYMLTHLQDLPYAIFHWSALLSTKEGIYSMDWWWLQGLDEGTLIVPLFHVSLIYISHLNRYIYLPSKTVFPMQWLRLYKPSFDICYIAQHSVHDTQCLKALEDTLDWFYQHHNIFRTNSICLSGFNLLHSHTAVHYLHFIWAFGTPNGLCSTITKSKYIYLDKLVAVQVNFASHSMLEGTMIKGVLSQLGE